MFINASQPFTNEVRRSVNQIVFCLKSCLKIYGGKWMWWSARRVELWKNGGCGGAAQRAKQKDGPAGAVQCVETKDAALQLLSVVLPGPF